ncbi:MAG: hypothetical protein KBD56_01605 [Candidatus Eisenbacteria bacterium]|nr:hypothetical protein [Candidatus Eisenbacteria bacterium]
MAFDGKVVVDGNEIDKVRDVRFGVRNAVDDITTNPSGSTRNNLIIIEREHDATTNFWAWAVSAKKENRKNGRIEFYDQAKVLMIAEFTNALVHRYEVFLGENPFDRTALQLRERIHISTERLALETPNGRVEHNDQWGVR